MTNSSDDSLGKSRVNAQTSEDSLNKISNPPTAAIITEIDGEQRSYFSAELLDSVEVEKGDELVTRSDHEEHTQELVNQAVEEGRQDERRKLLILIDQLSADSEAEARAQHKPTDDFLQGWEGALESLRKEVEADE